MLTRSRRSWEIRTSLVTPEEIYLRRRSFLGALGGIAAASLTAPQQALAVDAPTVGVEAARYPGARNENYRIDRPLTDEKLVAGYNNFYEFGMSKNIVTAAQSLELRPWMIMIGGMVEKPFTIDADALIKAMPLEERLYRHRCVEAWSIAVPWTGFPLKALVDFARPLGSAKYLKMVTFKNPDIAPGQRQFWYPWPYVEGLTVAEATNELAFVSTGMYGKPLPKQNGAPLRLTVPWKYGFKSIKSIVLFEFTDERPKSFWEGLQAQEYGFWANVNPKVPHPRWSQATEEQIGTGNRVPTLLFNGYAEQVAGLYQGLEGERLYV